MSTDFLDKVRALRLDRVRTEVQKQAGAALAGTRAALAPWLGRAGTAMAPLVARMAPVTTPLIASASRALAPVGSALETVVARAQDAIRPWVKKLGIRGPGHSIAVSIVLLNLIGLLILVLTIMFFSPYQAWLINSRKESMMSQGTMLAALVSNHALAQTARVNLDPELLDPSQATELTAATKRLANLRLPLRMDKVALALRQSLEDTGIRARLYSTSGDLVLDSDDLFGTRQPDEVIPPEEIGVPLTSWWTTYSDWLDGTDLPVYRDIGRQRGTLYPEVLGALQGQTQPLVLMNERGRRMVGVVAPVQRPGAVLGALMLSTREGEIDKLLWRERRAILWLSAFGFVAMGISSWLLSQKIAKPLRELSHAAERVQSSLSRREELPDHSRRGDEIGDLSNSLRAMTDGLYQRIEASERFAADVAHELKNPLCSVRNAAETLPLVKNETDRAQLYGLIRDDVKRLTRLIDDISKATRVVAEMAFNEAQPVDVADVLRTVIDIGNDVHVKDEQKVTLKLDAAGYVEPFVVEGHDVRIGQVFKNLIDNALSFSPAKGVVAVHAARSGDTLTVTIDDDGPGIPNGNFERIFLRFYTDRPEQHFGNNSGLGLSICKEIVEAHHGKIWAENRVENVVHRTGTSDLGVVEGRVLGARFTVVLPAHSMLLAAKPPRRGHTRS